MPPSLHPFSCFKSTQEERDAGRDEGGQDLEESEVVDLGEEGFLSFILAVEASESLSFGVSLSVSIGSVQSESRGGTDERGTEPLTESIANSTAEHFAVVCPTCGKVFKTMNESTKFWALKSIKTSH